MIGASCFDLASFSPGRPELQHVLIPSMHMARLGIVICIDSVLPGESVGEC